MKRGVVRWLLASVGIVVMVLVLVLGGISTYFFLKYRPQLSQLRDAHLKMNKELTASVDSEFPVNITFDHRFEIRFKKDIPLDIPIRAMLEVPLEETFQVPITDSISVKLDRGFFLDEELHVQTLMPLDTNVQTRLMGADITLPIKGSVPVDITFPLKQEIGIKGHLALHVTDPISVKVQQVLEVPISFVVKGVLPVDELISVPIYTNMNGEVAIRDKLPCTIELDLSWEDWGQGIRVVR